MRVALYWTPALGDALGTAGNGWLGRDPERGLDMAQPAVQGLADATAAPRLYGFHATLRPPMRLATDWDAFMRTAHRLARETPPFDLPTLSVQDYGGFIALRETAPCLSLQALADSCVRVTDPHRRPADAAELSWRRRNGLTDRQDAMLLRWGYPFVMQQWRFHMTLSGRLDAAEMTRLLPAADAHFAAALHARRRVSELTVFTQVEGRPFLIAERLLLRG